MIRIVPDRLMDDSPVKKVGLTTSIRAIALGPEMKMAKDCEITKLNRGA